jgi:hypothetical protein
MKKNNRTLQYILAIVAIGVWGAIIYRVVQYYKGDNSQFTITTQPVPDLVSPTDTPQMSYALSLDYPDPFLGAKKTKRKSTRTNSTKGTNKKATATEEEKTWPNIIYTGYSLVNDGKPSLMFKIDGKNYVIHLGEQVEGIKTIEANNNFVLVQWNGESKKISRN